MIVDDTTVLLINPHKITLFEAEHLKETLPYFPDLDLTHIKRLSNLVGIAQHAKYTIPDYHHGYCLDDNARALILASTAYEVSPSPDTKKLTSTYLAYIYYMQLESGIFRNFLSFDNQFLDDEGTEDSYGRTVWALGHFLRITTQGEFTLLAKEIFLRALPHALKLRSVRAVAYSLIGLIYYLQKYPDDSDSRNHVKSLVDFLVNEYQQSLSPDWYWYEKVISYDNAILPLSMLRAAQILQDELIYEIGMQSAQFLDNIIFEKEYLSTIGNLEWYRQGGTRSIFGQQPVEIASIILLYKELFIQQRTPVYRQRALKSFQWFFGENELGLRLYDTISKGCCDGMDSHGINFNQGAESTISFWLSYLYISQPVS
ncbi:MAG TPA: hypothetical protein PKA53_09355 [Sphingobacterium sp.]|nr:hypothetical protein [Sphingobacterium sp.]